MLLRYKDENCAAFDSFSGHPMRLQVLGEHGIDAARGAGPPPTCEWFPVAHGNVGVGLHALVLERLLQRGCLLVGDAAQGRAAANGLVSLLGLGRAEGADQLRDEGLRKL
jgi:hypothetical protein